MTEAEWNSSDSPSAMLRHLTHEHVHAAGQFGTTIPREVPLVSARKLRLIAVACCRSVFALLPDPRSRHAVEVAEAFAEGEATVEELAAASSGAASARHDIGYEPGGISTPAHLAHVAPVREWQSIVSFYSRTASHALVPPAAQASLIRAIVNPFAPPLPRVCPKCAGELKPTAIPEREPRMYCERCNDYPPTEPAPPCPWVTPTVLALATAAYASRRRVPCEACGGDSVDYRRDWKCGTCRGESCISDGFLDPDACAVLADALDDAGCADETILDHLRGRIWCPSCNGDGEVMHNRLVSKCSACRGSGKLIAAGRVYCRGDWVLDALTGRS